jgi:short-chain Z-isoprenyl diphosphate synthase
MRTPGKQRLRDVVYGLYERRLARSFTPEQIPRHIGVIIDGNRRWARAAGEVVSSGHRAGANKISEFLEWCDEVGVKVVTVWMLSTDNLSRPAEELEPLLRIIEKTVDELTAIGRWKIHPVGALDLLPAPTAEALKAADAATHKVDGMLVNVAVGYGGRRELADAVRSLLLEEAAKGISIEELAERVDVEHIAEHLYTKGQPDPDLVIRTSGEQRLGGFLLWQSALSEFYFCEALWPDFRHVDFLRAIRSYAQRERRLGR